MVAPLAAGSGLRKVTGGVIDQEDVVGSAVLGGLIRETPEVSGSSLPTSTMVSSCPLTSVCDAAVLVGGGVVTKDLQIGDSVDAVRCRGSPGSAGGQGGIEVAAY
ncbi:hypothetical protein Dimus_022441 [Dionaea muscipula]